MSRSSDLFYASPKQIARRIRSLRNQCGLTQTQLAKLAHIDQRQVSRIERAEAGSISLSDFLSLAAALDVDPNTLAMRDDREFCKKADTILTVATGTILDEVSVGGGLRLGSLNILVGDGAPKRFVDLAHTAGSACGLSSSINDLFVEDRPDLFVIDWQNMPYDDALAQALFPLARHTKTAIVLAPPANASPDVWALSCSSVTAAVADSILHLTETGQRVLKNRYGPATEAA